MRKQGNLLLRGLGVSVMALGLMGIGGASVSAQGVVCSLKPQLELADRNEDGTVTIDEIDRIISLSGNNADLQAARDQAVAAGVTGIQYRDCTPGGEDPTAPGAGETPDTGDDTDVDQDAGDGTEQDADADTGVDQDTDDGTEQDVDADTGVDQDADGGDTGADDDVTAPGDGVADGDDNGDVTDLPETGVGQTSDSNTQSMIMLGVGGALLAAGAYTIRTKFEA